MPSRLSPIPNSGLIVTGSNFAITHRELIIKLAREQELPTIYPIRFFAVAGGLIAYGPDGIDVHRRAAGYIYRISRPEAGRASGAGPTKYELVNN